MKRILLSLVCVAGLVLGLSACNPQEVSKDAIRQNFPEASSKAIAVAQCESGLNPEAVSAGGRNIGLFQINSVHQPMVQRMGYQWDQMTDPYVNSKVARRLYDNAGGWGPWSCRHAS